MCRDAEFTHEQFVVLVCSYPAVVHAAIPFERARVAISLAARALPSKKDRRIALTKGNTCVGPCARENTTTTTELVCKIQGIFGGW